MDRLEIMVCDCMIGTFVDLRHVNMYIISNIYVIEPYLLELKCCFNEFRCFTIVLSQCLAGAKFYPKIILFSLSFEIINHCSAFDEVCSFWIQKNDTARICCTAKK